ncbi:PAS domain S-box-containing protein [Noviherbaspirillum humi]|uniref:histidine kinase n=2 Tax=Noviherbaspirillum humi TaxID=1688639 RepID=A0A239F7M6_9BURK|nr:PAS domain S-box-containing protein [Noviherbaspirillum humi]
MRVLMAYGLTAGVLVVSGITAVLNARSQQETAREITHAQDIALALERIENALSDAETGQRGFLLTGQEDYLDPYRAARGETSIAVISRPSVSELIQSARRLLPSGSRQERLLDRVDRLARDKLSELEQTIRLYRSGRMREATEIVVNGDGKRMMDDIRAALVEMRAEDKFMLRQRQREHHDGAERALMSAGVVSLLSLVTLAILMNVSNASSRSLRRSEQRFRSLVEAASAVVWVTDADGRMTADKPSWRAFTGQGREAAAMFGWMDALHPETRQAIQRALDARSREGGALRWPERWRVRRHDGQYREMIVRCVAMPAAEAGTEEWIGACTDVTELANAESRMRCFAESDVIGIVFGDMSGGIRYANDEYLRTIGYERADLDSGALRWDAITPPEWLAVDRRHVEQARRTGTCPRYEKEYVRKNGSRVPVLVGFGMIGEEDEVVAFVLDLSDQKEAEATLRRREEEFRTLADNISQLAWMADPRGGIFWYNRRWFDYTAVSQRTMLESGWQAMLHPDHALRVEDKLRACLQNGMPWEDSFPLRGADGRYRWFLSRALPIHDERGNVVRWFGTHTDVTAQRELEEELTRVNRRKDEFIATLAHELRNPLAPVQAGLELLKLPGNATPAAAKVHAIMTRQIAHLVRLIDDLLDVSRITSGKLELRRETISVGAVLDTALEECRLKLEAAGHEVEVNLPQQPLHIDADLVRMAQVLSNLLDNAAKYTPDGGRIVVGVDSRGDEVLISVTDNGIGIDADLLPRIFDLFTQLESARPRRRGGIGIGLSITRQIVALHGGVLSADSAGPGKGSTFSIRLPQAVPMSAGAKADPLSSRPGTSLACRRILILDDNADAADTLGALLAMSGHEIHVAHTGAEAIDMAQRLHPDIAFLDIGLPDMSGHEVARALRAIASLNGLVLVALTGWGADSDVRQSREAGFDFHLTKPVTTAAIKAILPNLKTPLD